MFIMVLPTNSKIGAFVLRINSECNCANVQFGQAIFIDNTTNQQVSYGNWVGKRYSSNENLNFFRFVKNANDTFMDTNGFPVVGGHPFTIIFSIGATSNSASRYVILIKLQTVAVVTLVLLFWIHKKK